MMIIVTPRSTLKWTSGSMLTMNIMTRMIIVMMKDSTVSLDHLLVEAVFGCRLVWDDRRGTNVSFEDLLRFPRLQADGRSAAFAKSPVIAS
jgi:hypothetical protein